MVRTGLANFERVRMVDIWFVIDVLLPEDGLTRLVLVVLARSLRAEGIQQSAILLPGSLKLFFLL